jgi:hypothetical protein
MFTLLTPAAEHDSLACEVDLLSELSGLLMSTLGSLHEDVFDFRKAMTVTIEQHGLPTEERVCPIVRLDVWII